MDELDEEDDDGDVPVDRIGAAVGDAASAVVVGAAVGCDEGAEVELEGGVTVLVVGATDVGGIVGTPEGGELSEMVGAAGAPKGAIVVVVVGTRDGIRVGVMDVVNAAPVGAAHVGLADVGVGVAGPIVGSTGLRVGASDAIPNGAIVVVVVGADEGSSVGDIDVVSAAGASHVG